MRSRGQIVFFSKFDRGGPYDRRYKEIYEPLCRSLGFELYRVDMDAAAMIPSETLRERVRNSVFCLADLTSANPNVLYEVGLAHGLGKEVIPMIAYGKCLPFDLRHIRVISYKTETPGDFEALRAELLASLTALANKLVKASDPHPHAIGVMKVLLDAHAGLGEYEISQALGEAGEQRRNTKLSIRELLLINFIAAVPMVDFEHSQLEAYGLTTEGVEWLLKNRDRL